MRDINRAIIHKVMPSPFSHSWGKKTQAEQGRIVMEQVRTAYLLEFKQPDSKGHNEPRFHFITNGTIASRKYNVSLPYPETVIPTELHSEKENEFEGLSMTLILPNTTVLDPIQTDKHKANQQSIY